VAASGSDSGLGAFESDVAARLAALGIMVVPQYGVGGYRVDFAAAHPDDPSRMILAVEADGASYRDSRSVRDRDRLRKEHLERLGWRVHRLWSTSWFTDPDAELAKLRAAYAEAVRANPPAPPPPPADPPAAGPSSAGERSSSAAPPATAEPAPAGEPPLADDPPGPIDRPTPAPSVTGATRIPIALPARTVTPVEGPPPSRALPPIPRS
jgi:very-short-patch-repair endonuclease